MSSDLAITRLWGTVAAPRKDGAPPAGDASHERHDARTPSPRRGERPRLHYTVAGSGEPMVLLHGFPMTSYYWGKIIPAGATLHRRGARPSRLPGRVHQLRHDPVDGGASRFAF